MGSFKRILCCKKKRIVARTQLEKIELAKKRWKKVWLLRNILVTVDE
jgi:hypothetical protein